MVGGGLWLMFQGRSVARTRGRRRTRGRPRRATARPGGGCGCSCCSATATGAGIAPARRGQWIMSSRSTAAGAATRGTSWPAAWPATRRSSIGRRRGCGGRRTVRRRTCPCGEGGLGDADPGRESWSEHAEGLEGEQLALALLRAYISPAEEDLGAVLDRAFELVVAAAADEED